MVSEDARMEEAISSQAVNSKSSNMYSQITTRMLVDILRQEGGQVPWVQHLWAWEGIGGAEDVVDGGDVVGPIVKWGRCLVVIRVSAVRVLTAFVAVTVALRPLFVDVEVLGRYV